MYGIKIGEFHSYRDFGLVPTSKPFVSLPKPKLEYIQIPGRQGEIDISESLTGEVIYEMRTGSFEFMVSDPEKWKEVYKKLLTTVHGKKINLILDTEKEFVYHGRVWVSEFKSDKNYSLITLDYKLEPYKYSVDDIKDDGEIIHRLDDINIKGSKTIRLKFDSDMTIVPEFHNKSWGIITLKFKGKKYEIFKGVNKFGEVRGRKDIELSFSGDSTIDISYKRGWL